MTASIRLSWAEIVDRCSRIHTTRTRPMFPFSDRPDLLREDSRALEIWFRGKEARIVPTRMHEPGFYWWLEGEPMRSDAHIQILQDAVDAGEVYLRENPDP